MQRARSISRICIALVIVCYFGYILNQHIPFTGIHTISYTFDRPDGAIGVPRPPARFELIRDDSGKQIAKVIEDPLYFDIKTLVSYQLAKISFSYQKHTNRTVQLALKSSETGQQFTTMRFSEKRDGEWTIGTADVDMNHMVRQNGKYTLAFSVPGLIANTSDDYILVSRMDITLVRKSLLQTLHDRL